MKNKLNEIMKSRSPIRKREVVKPINTFTSKNNSKSSKQLTNITTNLLVNKHTNLQLIRHTTYLTPELKKTLKLFAVNHEMKDYEVLQEALNKFFKIGQ